MPLEGLRFLAAAIFVVALALLAAGSRAQSPADAGTMRADVYLFWAQGCPHCDRAIQFLKRLEAEEPHVHVHYLEVSRDAANREAFLELLRASGTDEAGVPFVVVGDRVSVGYLDDATTGAAIRSEALGCLVARCPDRVRPLLGTAPQTAPDAPASRAMRAPALPTQISLPIVGTLHLQDLSLPALTVVLGAVDGFNPCAMWTLVFLIGLLVGMQDRARRWTLGLAFVVASAFVYYLIMAAWLNVLLFLGMVTWIRVGIALVALAAGFYYLREFVMKKEVVCEVTSPERRQRVFAKLRALASEQRFLVAFGGIVLLAFTVNVVELLCSAGIPAVYTQVLAMGDLPRWQHHAYLALYIVVFMLDDLIVFFTAMATLEVTGMTGTYTRWAQLVGGGVLLAIGAVMLLRPEMLMFG